MSCKHLSFISSTALALGFLLSGCSGGSSSATSSFTGAVIDGYIESAKVCLDLNANLECDENEPTDLTDAAGNYSFQYAGDTTGMHVLALVTTESVDSELGAITRPFNLLAPAEAPKAITPLSTLVSAEMIEAGVTASDAQAAVKVALGTNKELLDYDFKFANDSETLLVAQITAAALANIKNEIQSNPSGALLSKADVMKASISQVKTSVLPSVLSADGKLNLDLSGVKSQADIESKLNEAVNIKAVVEGKIQDVVARSKSGSGEVLDVEKLFREGFISIRRDSARLDLPNQGDIRLDNVLKAEFIKRIDSETSAFGYERILHWPTSSEAPVWEKPYQWPETSLAFNGSQWITSQKLETFIFDQNCVFLTNFGNESTVFQKYCAVKRDLSGKKITDFIPGLCATNGDDGKEDARLLATKKDCDEEAIFPDGSYGVDLTVSAAQDTYWLNVSDNGSPYSATINQFLEDVSSPGFASLGQACNILFRFSDIEKDATGNPLSGTMNWGANAEGCFGSENGSSLTFSEATDFTIVSLGGKTIIKALASNVYRKANPDEQDPYLIFGEATHPDGSIGVTNGSMAPGNAKLTIQFTGDPDRSMQVMSTIAFNAIIKEMGLPPYPYP